jgi:RNA polymerase sigma-70 factor (ECF subfamily)
MIVDEVAKLARFEEACLPHMRAAYDLARWLARDEHEAADIVQEAYLRALRYFDAAEGRGSRAWLLRIVRNAFYSARADHRRETGAASFDEEVHSGGRDPFNPEAPALLAADREMLREGLATLREEFREVIVLRELQGLSYKEIAEVADVPIGTVMSRLARAREALAAALAPRIGGERP